MESCQAEVLPVPPAHIPSEHVLLSSPADAAGRHGALLPVLGHREPAFRASRRGPDPLHQRLGPGRLGRRRLRLAGRALRPERHAAQPHEVGLETLPPPSPHRGRRERADRGPRRGRAQRMCEARERSGSNTPCRGSRDALGLGLPAAAEPRTGRRPPGCRRGAGSSAAGGKARRRRRCGRQPRAVHVASPGPRPRATPGPPEGGGGKLQK